MIFPRCHCLVVSLSSSSHWLEKNPSSPEGAWPALKAVGEMLARHRNRWQQQVWWARDDKGTECAAGKLSETRVQELPMQGKRGDGGTGRAEQGRTGCQSRMTGTPWTSTNGERDESGSGGLQPQTGWGGSHHDGRGACGTPADVRVTQSSHARRQSTHCSHHGERKTKRKEPWWYLLFIYCWCSFCFPLREQDLRGAWASPNAR